MMAMILGYELFEILRPRRSKRLPRHFVLAVTPTEVVAFKATGGSGENDYTYILDIREGIVARFPRDAGSTSGLEEGEKSKDGTPTVEGESPPVARPNLGGDPSTDELLGVLSKQSAAFV
jgi:hypothetical protein